jgi:hypothetical protein
VKQIAILSNRTCPYCGISLEAIPWDTDHVIGRRFVPKGSLDRRWNLKLRSCRACNARKAALEDDLSAITMQPAATGVFPRDDDLFVAEAKRKGKNSISRRTRKPVESSQEELELAFFPVSGAQFRISLVAPPQADSARVFALARLQTAAFFYWLTYGPDAHDGKWWPGKFMPLCQSFRGDWGNVVQVAFMEMVNAWEPRAVIVTARGFFKIAIRRNPEATCWSWALEWNENLRLIGFFGDPAPAQALLENLPEAETRVLSQPSGHMTYRLEEPLADTADFLFALPDHSTECGMN